MSGAGDDAPFGISRRRFLISIAVAVILVVGAAGLIGQVTNLGKMTKAASQAQLVWLPVCLAGELLAYLGYVLAYRDVARVGGGPRLSPWTATRVVVLGFGAFAIGSGAGGLAADFWALHRASDRPHQSARRVLGMNTLEWAVLGTFACIAAALKNRGRRLVGADRHDDRLDRRRARLRRARDLVHPARAGRTFLTPRPER